MSERIITAKRNLPCDLCGHMIPSGTKCRIIKDDFMPGIVHFEHLRCPSHSASAYAPVVIIPRKVKKETAYAPVVIIPRKVKKETAYA